MPQVTVKINGRSYTLACDEGEEEHLVGLAAYLDKHVTSLSQGVGQVGDQRLMLMAGLLVADELSEALGEVKALEDQVAALKDARTGAASKTQDAENQVAEVLEAAAKRLEDIAGRLEAS